MVGPASAVPDRRYRRRWRLATAARHPLPARSGPGQQAV